ncbi:metallophosphoesterase family protein [Megalodesulfovibrio gigas]|uniref:Putative phosphohydrolase n=1 Tax=Megalodesulfovibrio gigas (strain ATCC 19364 / DSM 1382 / NCIMB 9332 / VKM B-1759) TaxID=1121448 RepID=T2GFL2_MEGG1|nr:metallophosphoesterase [Megalodesulfovibrio gigas]AGW14979.1 putative phosphohydrolase [Megalodesulfovibrio gigas DSM 1382 = ATCC 19364]
MLRHHLAPSSTTRLAHLSDLHFGDQPGGLARSLALALEHAAPDLVIVSGDLTQRARPGQFLEAKAWLDALARPVLLVPGNHDLPLLALWSRLLRPRRRFQQLATMDRAPCWRSEQVLVHGADSTRRWRWKSGRAPGWCGGAGAGQVRVLAVHHPLGGTPRPHPPAVTAMPMADVVLAGHDHHSRVELLRTATTPAGVLQLVAGTALSRRLRGEANSFLLLDVTVNPLGGQHATACLQVQRWEHADDGFAPAAAQAFSKQLGQDDTGWTAWQEPVIECTRRD